MCFSFPQTEKEIKTVKKLALAIGLVLGLSIQAQAQHHHAQRHYHQRTDHYAGYFNYWALYQGPYSSYVPGSQLGGAGMVVGTSLSCNVCGMAGHYSCGANVPVYVNHYSWDFMP